MKLAVASDHGGFDLKGEVLKFLQERKIQAVDLGSEGLQSVDYPDYAALVARAVSSGRADGGVLVCGTGIGMCIVANKFKGVRAAVVSDPYSARMAKEHNNANVLCVGGRVLNQKGQPEIEAILSAWLDASYEGGRHDRRLNKIKRIENQNLK